MAAKQFHRRRSKDDGEKPFWISFSDLMTAMMVMFLVVMAVALLAVTSPSEKRQEEIENWVKQLEQKLKSDFPGVNYQRNRNVIDFGSQAKFKFGKPDFEGSPQELEKKEDALRKFVPELLALANADLGKKVIKRVVVEGYTDKTGNYLSNLDLSLRRSERVLCVLLADAVSTKLSDAQKRQVLELFLVGGYSFNNEKSSDDESRRVEMRIEFLGPFESRTPAPSNVEFGKCPI
jgi:outer membrane protein OmpA-like peptidoglycan-associated protein